MGYSIDDVILTAKNEVGYLEKQSGNIAFLNDKKANAGKNNYTKYGLQRGCQGQPWCDAFVDWCFISTYGEQVAKELLCGFSNYTPTSAGFFKKNGLWTTMKPQRGDIIFFKNAVRINHTGIVYEVDQHRIYTIEGNTSSGPMVIANGGAVCMKEYNPTNSRIAGYGRPNYTMTKYPTVYRGCYGPHVLKMQQLLNKGFPYNKIAEDSDFGPASLNKLVEVQSLMGIEHDGICGPKTWSHLV